MKHQAANIEVGTMKITYINNIDEDMDKHKTYTFKNNKLPHNSVCFLSKEVLNRSSNKASHHERHCYARYIIYIMLFLLIATLKTQQRK